MTFGFAFLEELLSRKGHSDTALANVLDVTPQAIQGWKVSNRIPTKRVSQIADYFRLGPIEIDRLLGVEPLQVDFRTKRGDHLKEIEVSDKNRVRSQVIFERFFEGNQSEITYDFENLRSDIRKTDGNFFKIAQLIRAEFTIPDYRPLGYDDLNALQRLIGARVLYLPFRQIGINSAPCGEDQGQTAILYRKNKSYSILLDSDRTTDEAHFDKMHETLHIILGDTFEQSQELEDMIDKVSGELIYPRRFLVVQFFNNDEHSRPIKNRELLRSKFYELNAELRLILSPRGIARAMRDSELTSRNSELYNYLNTELHTEVRAHSLTYSQFGEMDFAFSDRDRLLAFYRDHVEKPEKTGIYPLFVKLKDDMMSGAIPIADFADTFGLDYADAIVIKAIWEKENQRQ